MDPRKNVCQMVRSMPEGDDDDDDDDVFFHNMHSCLNYYAKGEKEKSSRGPPRT